VLAPSAAPMDLASAVVHAPGEMPGTPAAAALAAASSPELPIGECAALIGLDWGDEKHAIALQARGTHKVEKLMLPHSAESLHAWLDGLQARFGGQQVAVAVEATKGAVVSVLLEHPWLLIYPVHPTTSRRFSTAFTPSGAKDDAPDADVLLEILSLHRHRLRVLVPQDTQTRYLGHLVELRRGLVDQRTQFSNELTSLLKNYFPQALPLIGDKPAAPLALAFLERWPELVELQRARPQTVRAFYYGQHVRRPELIEQRLELIRTARPLTQDRALCAAGRLKLRALLALLRVLHAQIAEIDQALHTTFADYPEAALLAELPGAGPAMAPRLAVLFGRDRARWTSPEEMQKYYGIAPVTKRSGQQLTVHWRWNAPRFARQTLMEWTGLTVQYSRWAKAYYLQRKARGIGHAVILRALAFKWLRILWKCWQTGQPYDEARYLARLQQRNPALFALLPAV
jgi:transposase